MKVLLVVVDSLKRSLLCDYLASEPLLKVVGDAADGEGAVRLAASLVPDVVLMEIQLPRMDGIQATVRMTQEMGGIAPRVIALTRLRSKSHELVKAFEAGAYDFVDERGDLRELVRKIQTVVDRERPNLPDDFGDMYADYKSDRTREKKAARTVHGLSPRQKEILHLLAEGCTNAEIERALFVENQSVRNQVSRILAKLGVQDRTQAALWALKNGFGNKRKR